MVARIAALCLFLAAGGGTAAAKSIVLNGNTVVDTAAVKIEFRSDDNNQLVVTVRVPGSAINYQCKGTFPKNKIETVANGLAKLLNDGQNIAMPDFLKGQGMNGCQTY